MFQIVLAEAQRQKFEHLEITGVEVGAWTKRGFVDHGLGVIVKAGEQRVLGKKGGGAEVEIAIQKKIGFKPSLKIWGSYWTLSTKVHYNMQFKKGDGLQQVKGVIVENQRVWIPEEKAEATVEIVNEAGVVAGIEEEAEVVAENEEEAEVVVGITGEVEVVVMTDTVVVISGVQVEIGTVGRGILAVIVDPETVQKVVQVEQ